MLITPTGDDHVFVAAPYFADRAGREVGIYRGTEIGT